MALRNHTTLDASEPLRRGNHSHVMTTPQAMASRFADHPEAVRETLLLAERLTFDLEQGPRLSLSGRRGRDASRRLAELCAARLQERYGARRRRAPARAGRRRLERRLRAGAARDRQAGAGGLLPAAPRHARARPRGGRRGARARLGARAAGARARAGLLGLLAGLLPHGLSHIDPVANRLALGRFLHEDLHGLPDIDLDFPRDIRERLIPRVHERYGRDRAALVAAFPTFRARGAIRELGKVLGLPPGEIERIGARRRRATGPAPSTTSATCARGEERPGGGTPDGAAADRRSRALALARRGWSSRRTGCPATSPSTPGGMIVATRPLIDCCPVVPAAMEGRQMVQWDKDSCADAGFLKIDLLGLGMLSAVERCVEEIARVHGERIDLSRIPFDDARDVPRDPRGGHRRRLPDREPRADAVAAAHAAGEPRGPHDPGRDRAAGADPGRRGQPLHRAPPAPARGPRLRDPLRASRARAGAAGDARHDHLPGPGDAGRRSVRRLHAPARPTGCAGR